MWTRIFLLAALTAPLLGALPSDEIAFAQDAKSSRCSKTVTGALWSQVDWLRLEISGGRIKLASRRCGQTRVTVEPTETSPLRQSLSVNAQAATLLATYEAADEREWVMLTLDARAQVTIVREPYAAGVLELRYVQPAVGPVFVTIGADEPRKYAAASLWHLLMAEPIAREQLLPILTKIRPTWRLTDQLGAVDNALVAAAGIDRAVQRRTWQALVEQLADPSFARRREADQALRAAGLAVLVHLRQLDPATLDREQQQRIWGILSANDDAGHDSADRVAGWLADDKRVWLALLRRPDQATSLAAAGHLSLLAGKPIAIDPSASDERKAQQIVELQALLAEN